MIMVASGVGGGALVSRGCRLRSILDLLALVCRYSAHPRYYLEWRVHDYRAAECVSRSLLRAMR